MLQKKIGPNFSNELMEANLMGLPFSWGDDGTFSFDESMRQQDIDSVLRVYEAHEPQFLT